MTVTILAFIYVPLNLATSIFGMNIQELNESGQKFWVFMTTAVTVIIMTTVSWFILEQVNSYKAWLRARGKPPKRRLRTEYTLATRVAMLVWLVRNGHKSWMHTSGAGWRILLNDNSWVTPWGLVNMNLPDSRRSEVARMTAGDYVTEFSAAPIPGFDPFDPQSTPWDGDLKDFFRQDDTPRPTSRHSRRSFSYHQPRNW